MENKYVIDALLLNFGIDKKDVRLVSRNTHESIVYEIVSKKSILKITRFKPAFYYETIDKKDVWPYVARTYKVGKIKIGSPKYLDYYGNHYCIDKNTRLSTVTTDEKLIYYVFMEKVDAEKAKKELTEIEKTIEAAFNTNMIYISNIIEDIKYLNNKIEKKLNKQQIKILRRIIEISDNLLKNGMSIIDVNRGNFGYNKKGELVILDMGTLGAYNIPASFSRKSHEYVKLEKMNSFSSNDK